ncbi:MAG: hypothetical protein RL732_665 [Bacteroidota bacterium]
MMRKVIRLLLLYSSFLFVTAPQVEGQNDLRTLQRFKFLLGGGFMVPQRLNGHMGIGFGIVMEPQYYIASRVGIGVLIGAGSVSRDIREHGEWISGRPFDLQVLAATADYYFIQPKRRFFVGAGVGDYTLDEQLEGTSTQFTIQRDELLGIMVRTGFEEKHIRVSVEYHFVEDAFFVADNNYLGLQVAYFWGGGKKKSNLRRE